MRYRLQNVAYYTQKYTFMHVMQAHYHNTVLYECIEQQDNNVFFFGFLTSYSSGSVSYHHTVKPVYAIFFYL